METGLIPPCLNYNTSKKSIKALEEGRIKVVTEVTPWQGGYVGINSFGFGGTNVHMLLKSNPKKKINNGAPSDDIPRLVLVSGRTQESIDVLLDQVSGKNSKKKRYILNINNTQRRFLFKENLT